MKTRLIYISTFLLLNTFTASALDNISLNSAMPNSEVRVTAAQEIRLLPGFTANAANGGTFHAKIGAPGEVYPLSLLPQTEPSQDRNFIHTRTYQSADAMQYLDQIQYYDGLGRPDELVLRGITPAGSDLASLTEYDAFGRAYKQWLPAPVSSLSGAEGGFVTPATLQNAAQSYYTDSRPFAETVFENSPLNRIEQQKGAGAAWDNKSVKTDYGTNGSEVPYFTVNAAGQLERNGNYPANNLYKTTTTDEDGKTTAEYKDKLGRVVMTMSGTDVKTVYVYNDLGQLAFVLPPLAVDGLSANAAIADNNDVLKRYAYLYKYDERGNAVEKRLPGCEPVYMVYDKSNRLILSQDGNQRTQQQWTVTKYDPLGRIAYTGTLPRNQSRTDLKNILDPLIITEQFVGASGFNNTGYTCGYFINEITPIAVNYYDSYAFLDLNTAQKPSLTYTTKAGFGEQYPNAKGLQTGSRVYLLDNSGNYLATAMYYDQKGQMIQSRAINHLNGFDFSYNAYNFAGQITKTQHDHTASNQSAISETYSYGYDHAGRQTAISYQLGNNPTITLAANTYDELGRLSQKKRHSGQDTETAQYNIRNQPTKLTSGSFEQKLYYNTNLPNEATAQFNGNISASTWTYDGLTQRYIYNYDALNRLTMAQFRDDGNFVWNLTWGEEFFGYDKLGNIISLMRLSNNGLTDLLTMNYEGNQVMSIYDAAGSQNLYNMKEYHDYNTTGNDFAYDANGNMTKDLDRKIVTIQYNMLNLPDIVQFSDGNQIRNLYSADGKKLKTDYYTQVTNLAEPITEGNIMQPNPATSEHTGTVYIGGIEYEIDNNITSLKRISNPEGYFADNKFHYYRRDHLGNNREVWRSDGQTVQRTQYYPSGLPWASNADDKPGEQPYKYNGKEFVEMHGLDEYDSEFRWYYPAIARTTTLDPHAESYYSLSPYSWLAGRLANAIDPNGRDVYMLFYTISDKRFKSAAETRQREIESMKGFDKAKDHVYIQEMGDLGTLSDRVTNIVQNATDNGYGKTVETSFWSHTGYDGPRADYATSNGKQLDDDLGYNQMNPKDWSNINFNFDTKNSIAAFYGCNSYSFAEKFLDYQPNVAFSAGQGGSAGPSYSTDKFDDVSRWRSLSIFSTSKNVYYGTRDNGLFYGPVVYSRKLDYFLTRGNASIINGAVQNIRK